MPTAASGRPPQRHGCGLASLTDPALAGAMPGLLATEGELVAQAAYFTCCAGHGLRLDAAAQTTTACRLSHHLRQARRVLRLWRSLQQGSDGDSGELTKCCVPRPFLERLAQLAGGQPGCGLAWHTPSASGQVAPDRSVAALLSAAMSVWPLAMAAAWRFGLRPHVVVLGRTAASDLVPGPDATPPDLLCIGAVAGLWEPYTAEQLEALIAYAYGALRPVFCQLTFDQRAAPTTRQVYASTKQGFARRLDGLKARSPLAWLDPSSAAKWPAVTAGLEPLLATARQDWAALQPKPAVQVRLPWDRR